MHRLRCPQAPRQPQLSQPRLSRSSKLSTLFRSQLVVEHLIGRRGEKHALPVRPCVSVWARCESVPITGTDHMRGGAPKPRRSGAPNGCGVAHLVDGPVPTSQIAQIELHGHPQLRGNGWHWEAWLTRPAVVLLDPCGFQRLPPRPCSLISRMPRLSSAPMRTMMAESWKNTSALMIEVRPA